MHVARYYESTMGHNPADVMELRRWKVGHLVKIGPMHTPFLVTALQVFEHQQVKAAASADCNAA